MMRIILLGLILLFINVAFANVYLLSDSSLPRGIEGKKAGEIISLQKDREIATWCDFNKQVVVTATSTLCVYKGN